MVPGNSAYRARLQVLKDLPAFAGLPDRVIEQIAEHVNEIVIQPGAHLCREGSQALEAFIILEGEANLIEKGQILRAIDPGELIGEIAVLSGKSRTASVRAVTVLKAFVLRPEDVRWLSEEPNAAPVVERAIARHTGRSPVPAALPKPANLGGVDVLEAARRSGATLALVAGVVLRRAAGVLAGPGQPPPKESPDHTGDD